MGVQSYDRALSERLKVLDAPTLRAVASSAALHAIADNPRLAAEVGASLLHRLQERLAAVHVSIAEDDELVATLRAESQRLDDRYWQAREEIENDDPQWPGSDGQLLFRCARSLDAAIFAMCSPPTSASVDAALYEALNAVADDTFDDVLVDARRAAGLSEDGSDREGTR